MISAEIILSITCAIITIIAMLIAVYQIRKTTEAQRDIKVFEFKKTTYCELLEAFANASVKINDDFDYEHLVCACYKALLFLPPSHQHVFEELLEDGANFRSAMARNDEPCVLQSYQKMSHSIQLAIYACRDNIRNDI